MVETTPYKVPPIAPVHVPIGAAANIQVHHGRNTSIPLGKAVGSD